MAVVVEVDTHLVKLAELEELVKSVEPELRRFKPPAGTPSYRSWKTFTAPGSRLVNMVEWDSLAEAEKWWAAWWADPGSKPHIERWYRAVVPGGSSEYWDLGSDVCGKC